MCEALEQRSPRTVLALALGLLALFGLSFLATTPDAGAASQSTAAEDPSWHEGFEDPGYEDRWTIELGEGASHERMSDPVRAGDHALKLTTGCGALDGQSHSVDLIRGIELPSEGNATVSTWVLSEQDGTWGTAGVLTLMKADASAPAIKLKIGADGADNKVFGYRIQRGDSHDTAEFGTWSEGTWYKLSIHVDTTANRLTLEAASEDGTIAQRTIEDAPVGFDRARIDANPGDHRGTCEDVFVFDDVSFTTSASTDPFAEWPEPKLPDEAGATFGVRLAAHGDTVAVGAIREADDQGAVYMYEGGPNGFQRIDKLVPPTEEGTEYFGGSLALDGDRLAIAERGTVYVYQRTDDGWRLEQTLDQPGRFGRSIALDGDRMAIGNHFASTDGSRDGVVYVYKHEGGEWTRTARLEDHGCQVTGGGGSGPGWEKCSNHRFGSNLALDGDVLAASAIGGDGEIHVFQKTDDGWQKIRTIEGHTPDDHLGGGGLSLEGDWLLAGAPRGDTEGEDAGYVLAVHRSDGEWTVEETLTSESLSAGERFGVVDHHGDRALVGADSADAGGRDVGVVYGFQQTSEGWEQRSRSQPEDVSPGDRVGLDILQTASLQAVGAFRADTEVGTDSGVVYLFDDRGSTKSPQPRTGLREAWNASVDAFVDDKAPSNPLAVPGKVLIGTADERFLALNQSMQEIDWSMDLSEHNKPLHWSPTPAYSPQLDRVFFHLMDNHPNSHETFVFAVDRESGELAWERHLGGYGLDNLQVQNGYLVEYAENSGDFIVLDTETGELVWRTSTGQCYGGEPGATVDGDVLYMTEDCGTLRAVDLATGEERWRTEIANRHSPSQPAIGESLVFVGHQSQTVHGVNAQTGEIVWSTDIEGRVDGIPPAYANGTVYVRTEAGSLYALDASSGEQVWKRDLGEPTESAPTLHEGRLFVGTTRGLEVLDSAAGETLDAFETPAPVASTAEVDGDRVFITDKTGTLRSLELTSGKDQPQRPETPPTDLDVSAEIVPDTFQAPGSGTTLGPGDVVRSTVEIRNTGERDYTFFVGYSARDEEGRTYDNEGQTGRFVNIPTGETRRVELAWTVPARAPSGTYDLTTAVWIDYPLPDDEDLDRTSWKQDTFSVHNPEATSLSPDLRTALDLYRDPATDATVRVSPPLILDGSEQRIAVYVGDGSFFDGRGIKEAAEVLSLLKEPSPGEMPFWESADVNKLLVLERTTDGYNRVTETEQVREVLELAAPGMSPIREDVGLGPDANDVYEPNPAMREDFQGFYDSWVFTFVRAKQPLTESARYGLAVREMLSQGQVSVLPADVEHELLNAESASEEASSTSERLAQAADTADDLLERMEDDSPAYRTVERYSSYLDAIEERAEDTSEAFDAMGSVLEHLLELSRVQSYSDRRIEMVETVLAYEQSREEDLLNDALEAELEVIVDEHDDSPAKIHGKIESKLVRLTKEKGLEAISSFDPVGLWKGFEAADALVDLEGKSQAALKAQYAARAADQFDRVADRVVDEQGGGELSEEPATGYRASLYLKRFAWATYWDANAEILAQESPAEQGWDAVLGLVQQEDSLDGSRERFGEQAERARAGVQRAFFPSTIEEALDAVPAGVGTETTGRATAEPAKLAAVSIGEQVPPPGDSGDLSGPAEQQLSSRHAVVTSIEGVEVAVDDQGDRVDLTVEAPHGDRGIVAMDLSRVSLGGLAPEEMAVLLDGQDIQAAESYEDLRDAQDEPVYLVAQGAESSELLVYVPHFSERVITIQSADWTSAGEDASAWLLPTLLIGGAAVVTGLMAASRIGIRRED